VAIISSFLYFNAPSPTFAQSYEGIYRFDFYPQKDGSVDAELNITLKSRRSDVYIDEFTVSIPNNFFSDKLIASIDAEGTDYKIESKKQGKRIIFSFNEPSTVPQTSHAIQLKYSHEGLFTQGDFVNELILPLIKAQDNSQVFVTLHLPNHIDKSVSIIKPKATTVQKNAIQWDNIQEDTLYVQFGQSNMFDVNLSYSLSNAELRPVERVIALPPDTGYQKVFIKRLDPKPSSVTIDEDGNYLASFRLKAREEIKVNMQGSIQVFSKTRGEFIQKIRKDIQTQKKYLLSETRHWSLGSTYDHEDIKKLYTAEDIYRYLIAEFIYNSDRISTSPDRRGAEEALLDPYSSLCTDFTDAFIAIAREKGIMAREIQGYGHSQMKNIRPLSLTSDVLHAWPEYYDKERETWVQIDPTWAQTSGINYFSGFDVMHVALAIHGKNSTSPLPAGFYKKGSQKSVDIKPGKSLPKESATINISHSIPDKIIAQKSYSSKLIITNTSNVFLYNLELTPIAQGISFQNSSIQVEQIAPYQTKVIELNYKAFGVGNSSETVTFLYKGNQVSHATVFIQTQTSNTLQLFIGVGIAVIILAGSFFIVRSRAS